MLGNATLRNAKESLLASQWHLVSRLKRNSFSLLSAFHQFVKSASDQILRRGWQADNIREPNSRLNFGKSTGNGASTTYEAHSGVFNSLNAHVERSHCTHHEEFYQVDADSDQPPRLNHQLRYWERTYNCVRPHQSLAYLTPLEFVTR